MEEVILTEQVMNEESFIEFLKQGKLMSSTIKDYLLYFNYLKHNFILQPFNQEVVNIYFTGRNQKGNKIEYLLRNNSLPGRAFLQKFKEYININKTSFNLNQEQMNEMNNIIIPKIKGRTANQLHSTALDEDELKLMEDTFEFYRERFTDNDESKKYLTLYLMFIITIYGGTRRSELLALTRNDLKMDKYKRLKELHPDGTKNLELEIEITKGKGNKRRTIFLPDKYIDLLKDYSSKVLKKSKYFLNKITEEEIKLKTYKFFPEMTEYLWITELKKVAILAGVRRYEAVRFRTNENGIKEDYKEVSSKLHPHDLRATCATLLDNKHASLEEIKDYLGHDNITTTDLYIKPDKKSIKRIFRNLK